MKSLIQIAVFLVLGSGAAQVGAGAEVSVETMPPVVVATQPRAGERGVDPGLKEIRITFNKDMMTDGMWSWVMVAPETFPEITGPVRFLEDNRTCVAPVSLEPGHTYVIWLNSDEHKGFRDTRNRPAIPYLLVFETGE